MVWPIRPESRQISVKHAAAKGLGRLGKLLEANSTLLVENGASETAVGYVEMRLSQEREEVRWRCSHNGNLIPEMFGEASPRKDPQSSADRGSRAITIASGSVWLDSALSGVASS